MLSSHMHSQIIFILEWNTTKFTCLRIVCVNSSLVTLKVTIAVKNLFAFITKYFILLSCFFFFFTLLDWWTSLIWFRNCSLLWDTFAHLEQLNIFARKIWLRSKNLISCGKSIMLIYLIIFIPVNLIKMSLVNTVWNSIAIVYL